MFGKFKSYFSLHWKLLLAGAVIFIATLWLFWPATGYDFLNFDDDRYVSENAVVQQGLSPESIRWAFRSIYESYWLPVMWLSYMVDSSVFGTAPFGYHLTNILLHSINAAMLFLLLNAWTKKFWSSVFIAALFAWHPLRVESVAWIAERKDVLSGFLVLLCLFLYRSFARKPHPGREVPAALFMALGLMTKPILVTLPFLLLLLDYWPLERISVNWKDLQEKGWKLISEKVLFWALMLLFCLLTYHTQKIGDAIHGADTIPWMRRWMAIPAAYVFYLGKIIFPVHLSLIYEELNVTPLRALASALLLLGITLTVLAAGRRHRALPVGWFWFMGLLVPVIGIVRVGVTHVADRFTYLPSIGLTIGVVWGVSTLLSRIKGRKFLFWGLGCAVLAGCIWQTRQTLPHWRNSIAAFENVLRYIPDSGVANNNYGEALLGTGQTEAALSHFEKAMSFDRRTTPFIANSALALLLLKRPDESIARLEKALVEINPRCPFLNLILGLSWMEKGEPDQAIPYLIRANTDSMIRPTWRVELARAYMEAGRTGEASNEFARIAGGGWALLSDFDGMCSYYTALWQKGHGQRAWTFFQQALSTHSNNIAMLNNVAWLLATDPPVGCDHKAAIQLATRAKDACEIIYPGILDTLAAAYAANNEFEEAVHWAQQAQMLAASNGLDGLALRIQARIRAYQSGRAWGKDGPVIQ